ncbi:hypothetical protein G9F72_024120 [Clostridium estertheticum]|uniref:hypothetical protein n=1 Tax=Clostridium estertheticum TaxID=238834 RepID=UPI0013E961A6|nr:hypothetical protein [Clostridium estertheticum]MBZ9689388.1 hypothetical protein [Clostridium estertheticum]
MSFKRFDGFTGSIPQKFIDKNFNSCPMCGTVEPYWTLEQKMGWVNRYLFKCSKCEAIISSSVPDVTGFGRSPLTTLGIAKALSGKKMSVIYMKIDDVGNMQVTKLYQGKEFPITELKEMADSLQVVE